jgi:hypothetical protein
MFVRSALLAAASAAALLLSSVGAMAAPQVLGLVASNGVPTPLTCDGVVCSAHFSAFCLQQNRPAPARGDSYTVAPGTEVTLVLTTADGKELRLPGREHLAIRSEIGFTSVSIALPQAKLAALGGQAVAVEVGAMVSLLPVTVAGDPYPQEADEVALATGPMRLAASHSFEVPGRASDAARITSFLINALPQDGGETDEARDALWVAMLDQPAASGATPEGIDAASRIYEGCRISVQSRSTYSMRNCLELRHADLLAETNHRFWRDSAGY